MALVGVAAFLRQNARHHAAQAVCHGHGGNLAAGENEVSHGDLLVHALVQKALVHPLIVAADQDQAVIPGLQLLGHLLVEYPAAGGEVDGVDPLASLLADVVPAAVQGVRLHNGSPASAIGIVVHLHLLIGGVIPDLVGGDPDIAPLLGPAHDGLAHHGVDGVGEQGHDVNFHRWPILSSGAPAFHRHRGPCSR